MKNQLLLGTFLLFAIFIFMAGCIGLPVQEPPVQEPSVSVSDISVSEISLQALTVNTTIAIFNPNPVIGNLKNVTFDLYSVDDTRTYLGHGEQSNIDLVNNGTTNVTIPISVGNIRALKAIESLVRDGSITLNVNGSALIDIKGTSFEKGFDQSRQFQVRYFESLLPVTIIPGTSINVTEKLEQLGRLLDAVRG
jgi:LEA14-like dessication related protein